MAHRYVAFMKGSAGLAATIKRAFFSITHQDELIAALQATESVLSTVTAEPNLWNAFNSRRIVFWGSALKGQQVWVNDVERNILELMNILALMVLIEIPFMDHRKWPRTAPCWKKGEKSPFGVLIELRNPTKFGINRDEWLRDDLPSKLRFQEAMYNMLKRECHEGTA